MTFLENCGMDFPPLLHTFMPSYTFFIICVDKFWPNTENNYLDQSYCSRCFLW